MKKTDKQTDEKRRKFLYGTLAGSAGAALAAAAPGIMASSTDAETADTGKSNQGYRLTQHISDYYKTAAS